MKIDRIIFERHYRPALKGSGPAEVIRKLAVEGNHAEAIQHFDPLPSQLPADPDTWNALTAVHLRVGNIERAAEINRAAIDKFEADCDSKKLANAMVYKARFVWDEHRYGDSLDIIRRALKVDASCSAAWLTWMCCASIQHDRAELERAVAAFRQCVVNWQEVEDYRLVFATDAELAWARRQTCFEPFVKSLDKKSEEVTDES